MKNQTLFSSKDKSKKLKCCLLQFLFGALRVQIQPLFELISPTKKDMHENAPALIGNGHGHSIGDGKSM